MFCLAVYYLGGKLNEEKTTLNQHFRKKVKFHSNTEEYAQSEVAESKQIVLIINTSVYSLLP
jgi:hypothetical protein